MKMQIIVLSCALMATSCGLGGQLQYSTSGQVGCKPEEITITDDTGMEGYRRTGVRNWTASCSGKDFYCTLTPNSGQNQSGNNVSCTEKASEKASSVNDNQVVSGCQNDTQCKGERICEEGNCISPPSTSENVNE